MTGSPPRPRRAAWRAPTGLLLGVAAGVLNLSFVVEPLLPGPARPGATVVSDLSVPGRPWSWAFRTADIASALCLLALCVLTLLMLTRRHHGVMGNAGLAQRAWTAGWVATAVFAVSTVVAAIVTETCAAGVDASCPDSLADAPAPDLVHDVVSSLGSSCGVVAALLLAVAMRQTRWLSRLHAVAFVVAAVTGLAFIALQAQPDDVVSGWVQRVQIVVLSAWFVVVGLTADHVVGRRGAAGADVAHEKMRT